MAVYSGGVQRCHRLRSPVTNSLREVCGPEADVASHFRSGPAAAPRDAENVRDDLDEERHGESPLVPATISSREEILLPSLG